MNGTIMASEWICPHCQRDQLLHKESLCSSHHHIFIEGTKEGHLGYLVVGIRCLSKLCGKLTLSFHLTKDVRAPEKGWRQGEILRTWHLLPPSSEKPQPDFIPAPIVKDYEEACAIKDLSPKASATLSRRCLQGMIRDYCGISKNRLIDEINELRELSSRDQAPRGVSEETIEAIDQIRKIGNIGAHMEKDINAIVDVEPKEAQLLIELIEMLFAEWYVAKRIREDRLASLSATANAKYVQRKLVKLQAVEDAEVPQSKE